jgi:DNA-binding CsgD family transcriptional regulator
MAEIYFSDQLSLARDTDCIETISKSISKSLRSFGFHSYSGALISEWSGDTAADGPDIKWLFGFDNNPRVQDWVDYYLGEQLERHDYGLRRHGTQIATRPFLIGRGAELSDQTAGERDMYDLASHAGLETGFVLPFSTIVGGTEKAIGYSVWSDMSAKDVGSVLREHGTTIELMLMGAKELILPGLKKLALGTAELSPREKDCLLYTALGQRAGQIAETLNIAEVTVNLHLKTARTKLSASTTAQAVARALTLRLIKL